TSMTIFGGVGQNPQVATLRRGVDIAIACPGRLEDLMGQRHADLGAIEVTILDEADHMADLGFLPGVRRIMDATPREGQRMLFSATLDAGVNVIVKRFLTSPVTHEADSAQSTISTMSHHVLHVSSEARIPVLLDLTAAPGRSVVFTRTKHGAKKLAKQLNAAGVPTVDLHGNLSQNARTRNMELFHSGEASTLVATDIAARGIHVDDVALVIHADPPTEHKAYLHRSGRTARAGADGTVVTLMMDDQVHDVRDLTRKAGIRPTTTRVTAAHPLLLELAPGERTYTPGGLVTASTEPSRTGRSDHSGAGRSGSRPARPQGGSGAGRGRRQPVAESGDGRRTAERPGGTSGGRSSQGRSGGSRGTSTQGSGGGQRSSQGAGGRSSGSRSSGSASVYSTSTGSGGSAAAFSTRTSPGRRSR
ncbi:MAG: DEAD/DEAH box helicase, partial [Lapillicoccus sp.]